MNLAEAIKKCSVDAWEAQVPCDFFFGKVTAVEPYRVALGDMEIPCEILYVPEHLMYKERKITLGIYTETIVINEGLKVGDCVILIRKNGVRGYAVAGKIQEG